MTAAVAVARSFGAGRCGGTGAVASWRDRIRARAPRGCRDMRD
ncbi:hypothetical protein C7S16_5558 [Burkholderia thailandensis]|uniref:Uncharacterized protein n=1 Tax=Burkholderia thailandensis TaxID=57975 RepID=A0AAW9CNT5_BURTH|nr:hypothetical protein [Burkholderia thailandensis]MDW9252284.1 hypothetical protein [Burkholderia thailandensis]